MRGATSRSSRAPTRPRASRADAPARPARPARPTSPAAPPLISSARARRARLHCMRATCARERQMAKRTKDGERGNGARQKKSAATKTPKAALKSAAAKMAETPDGRGPRSTERSAAEKRAATRAPASPRPSRRKAARTATGKPSSPEVLANAEASSLEGLKERTELGHLWSGRTPPSQQSETRRAGPTKKVIDTAIRDFASTEDEKLLQQQGPRIDFTRSDP